MYVFKCKWNVFCNPVITMVKLCRTVCFTLTYFFSLSTLLSVFQWDLKLSPDKKKTHRSHSRVIGWHWNTPHYPKSSSFFFLTEATTDSRYSEKTSRPALTCRNAFEFVWSSTLAYACNAHVMVCNNNKGHIKNHWMTLRALAFCLQSHHP